MRFLFVLILLASFSIYLTFAESVNRKLDKIIFEEEHDTPNFIFDKKLFIEKEGFEAYLQQELPYGNWVDDYDGALVEKDNGRYTFKNSKMIVDEDWCWKVF